MNEILILLLGIAGVFALGCSVALLALGKRIDIYPVGDESTRVRSLASPIESTRIAVFIFWLLFVVGIIGVLMETKFGLIAGITTLFAACLFMFTALVFSFAVLGAMKKRKDSTVFPVTGNPDSPVPTPALQLNPISTKTIGTRRYHTRASNFMIDSLTKKY